MAGVKKKKRLIPYMLKNKPKFVKKQKPFVLQKN